MTFHVPERYRLRTGRMASISAAGNNGAFMVPVRHGLVLATIASDDYGWEHVSVSLPQRCPKWSEMCAIKDLFWDPEDTVIQFHPPRSEYVNCHPFCLHLWRPVADGLLVPPSFLVRPG